MNNNRIIESTELSRSANEFGRMADVLTLYGGLETPFSNDVIVLADRHIDTIADFVRKSADAFGNENGSKEPTLAQTAYDIPSFIVRVDCTVVDGEIVAYEMEDSPSGQGVTDAVHRRIGGQGVRAIIRDHYEEQLGRLPFVVVSDMRSHGTDDAVIVGDDNYRFGSGPAIPKAGPVLVKAIPGNAASHQEFASLQPRAVAPLQTEGDKSYLERLGVLTPITTADQLLRNGDELASQVVKSRLGSMAMGVSLYLNPEDRAFFTRAGTVSASRLARDAELYMSERGGALVQPFIPPLRTMVEGEGRNAIMRVFALLGKGSNGTEVRVIGGCYVVRPEMIVHGARNAITGAVVV